MPEEIITLVDRDDTVIGGGEKMKVHGENVLHRAFSILVFTSEGKLILQRRAEGKYHCGGLWTNTCCGHPRYGEETPVAAARRLPEEMGFSCPLTEVGAFHYQIDFDNGLHENEIDHVFCGIYDGEVVPNPEEVGEVRYETLGILESEMAADPERFTYWFREIFKNKDLLDRIRGFTGTRIAKKRSDQDVVQ